MPQKQREKEGRPVQQPEEEEFQEPKEVDIDFRELEEIIEQARKESQRGRQSGQ